MVVRALGDRHGQHAPIAWFYYRHWVNNLWFLWTTLVTSQVFTLCVGHLPYSGVPYPCFHSRDTGGTWQQLSPTARCPSPDAFPTPYHQPSGWCLPPPTHGGGKTVAIPHSHTGIEPEQECIPPMDMCVQVVIRLLLPSGQGGHSTPTFVAWPFLCVMPSLAFEPQGGDDRQTFGGVCI